MFLGGGTIYYMAPVNSLWTHRDQRDHDNEEERGCGRSDEVSVGIERVRLGIEREEVRQEAKRATGNAPPVTTSTHFTEGLSMATKTKPKDTAS